ncbi:MAG: acyl-ACP--UDP-N-acetylglucosamine O-acyltransferase [Planctomycetes bacterium]|nr:acyl-ACP--UDP-N-acetylglucosamine O-acyltransferase [Planctomycetota bacterium]
MANIHSTAVVSPKAQLDPDVEIGAYAFIGDDVIIGAGTKIWNHVTITGHTTIGKNNKILPYAAIGLAPQDLTYKDEPTQVIIGDNNTIREFVTVNLGAVKGESKTVIGNNNLIMAYSHIAHDCILEDNIVMANSVQLAGHVKVEKCVSFSGLAGVHHFTTIGEYSFVGGVSRIVQDVPPFMMVHGNPARVRAVNIIGLERRGFSAEAVKAIKSAYKLIWHSKNTPMQAIRMLEKQKDNLPEVNTLIQFVKSAQKGVEGRAKELLRKKGF